jgi:hypothetical protein
MRHIFHIFSSHLLLKVLERTHDAYFLLNASVCVCVCVCRERERERLVGIIKLIIMQCISCRNFADKKEFFNLTFWNWGVHYVRGCIKFRKVVLLQY